MTYFLLVIIALLTYIAFFTPEKLRKIEIKRIQKIFNTPLSDYPLFKIDDLRNETHPDETVMYEFADGTRRISHRSLAVLTHKIGENQLDEPLPKVLYLKSDYYEARLRVDFARNKSYIKYDSSPAVETEIDNETETATRIMVGDNVISEDEYYS